MTTNTTNTTTATVSVTVPEIGVVDVTLTDSGEGHPVLLLHGGGGPLTVNGFAEQLAADQHSHARVITPSHPGFNGTPRPHTLTSIRGLASVYVALLQELDLRDVTVVGNSIGGWITAEMAVINSPTISSYVIVDAVGLDVPGHPVVDFFGLSPAEVAQRSYHDPDRYGIDPTTVSPEAQAQMAGNRETLVIYGGQSMTDSDLAARLAKISAPTLVIWGEADRIADPDYGRAYADAIPGASFELISDSGHLPQIETPQALIDLVWEFADRHATNKPNR